MRGLFLCLLSIAVVYIVCFSFLCVDGRSLFLICRGFCGLICVVVLVGFYGLTNCPGIVVSLSVWSRCVFFFC